ncbi:MAG: hypothetical protein ACPHK8_01285 [Thermoplasmatota archaeon]
MRWIVPLLLVVALAGCADSEPEPEQEFTPEPTPLPDNIAFSESGALEDGTTVVFPFDVDPRVRSLRATVYVEPNNDLARMTTDIAASLLHNGTFVSSGGSAGQSFFIGNGATEPILNYEERLPPEGNLTKLAGPWELRFSASGVQLADYRVEVSVTYV